jgi:hypothetical protein
VAAIAAELGLPEQTVYNLVRNIYLRVVELTCAWCSQTFEFEPVTKRPSYCSSRCRRYAASERYRERTASSGSAVEST